MEKDTQDEVSEPEMEIKSYLCEAYLHPVLRSFEEFELFELGVENNQAHHPSQLTTKPVSGSHSPSPIHEKDKETSSKRQHVEVLVEQHESVYSHDHNKSALKVDVTHH